ncbi:MAG TPA: hypothetical protein VM008_08620 [Phycisphaerae bacterium]|nr:hypothetical protein [Phycisphaerae bacterium]
MTRPAVVEKPKDSHAELRYGVPTPLVQVSAGKRTTTETRSNAAKDHEKR